MKKLQFNGIYWKKQCPIGSYIFKFQICCSNIELSEIYVLLISADGSSVNSKNEKNAFVERVGSHVSQSLKWKFEFTGPNQNL